MALAFPTGIQAGDSELLSELILGLNDLTSRTQEVISMDHKFAGPTRQNSEKCSR